MIAQRRHRGFTLLELLVALAVFALVSTMAYAGLRTVMEGKNATDLQAERLKLLQSTMMMLERDLSQASRRAIRDEFGDEQAAMSAGAYGEFRIQFTRAGRPNPMGIKRSRLQRIAYGIENGELVRYAWSVLDRPQGEEPATAVLLGGVRELSLRLLDGESEWHEQWPPEQFGDEPQPALPRAVELTLKMDAPGDIRRLIVLPHEPLAPTEDNGEEQ